jgi:thiol-disulfide isomerase/thioredoxin
LALAVAASLVLSGCVSGTGSVDTGYVSGDGTVTTWNASERGKPVELKGVDFTGHAVSVADFRGQVVLINTWYASCPPCRAEAPSLAAVNARADAAVIGLNGRDDAGTGLAFERTFAVTYPTISDLDGHAIAALQGLVALNAVPTTLVLDPQGRVAARIIGQADPSTLAALVDEAARTA